MKCLRSSAFQFVIAFIGATTLAVFTFRPILDARMAIYVRDYPHDGQDSLGAAMDAMMWFVVIEIVSWVLLYRLRKKIFGRLAEPPT